jgi:ATP-binding cassette subfamily B protein
MNDRPMNQRTSILFWPAARWGEAIEAVSRTAKLHPDSRNFVRAPDRLQQSSDEAFGNWVEDAAGALDLEEQPVSTSYGEAEAALRNAGPALIRIDLDGEAVLLAVVGSRRGRVRVLATDLSIRRVRPPWVAGLFRSLEKPALPEIDALLNSAGLRGRARNRISSQMLNDRLTGVPIRFWLLRTPPGKDFRGQLRQAGVIRRLAAFLTAHTAVYLMGLAAWWVIGRAALQGHLDYGWLLAWALLLISQAPLNMIALWMQGSLAIAAAGLLKQRLLAGSLHLRAEEVRREGSGQILGRVIESEALESLALSGGLASLVALIEICIAAAIFIFAAHSIPLALLLGGVTTLILWLMHRYFRVREDWTRRRLEITGSLVEKMMGHRTRSAQEPPSERHVAEDAALEDYLDSCSRMDRTLLPLMAALPRGWAIAGLLVLSIRLVGGETTSASLALAFGGILLAQRSLKSLTEGLGAIAGAAIAWNKAGPLFAAAANGDDLAHLSEAGPWDPSRFDPSRFAETPSHRPLVETRELIFRHEGRAEAAVDGCSLRVFRGDRVLLEGSSGSGKSTLVSLLSGLRDPDSGLVMLHGLDRRTLGVRAWRRMIAPAPQFNENHIFSGTLAFNLLMGRHWPPRPQDLEEAEIVCRELGLGELLDRMPAGLHQAIGEAGWLLSHGERSRVFLARALLQGAQFVILDESLGALDPATLPQVARSIRKRAPALMVIAHP